MANILLVEDDETISFGIRSALAKKGHEVACCSGMEEGKTLFSAKFDLILLDLNLPDGNGYDFCSWVKERSDSPIIFLTVRDDVNDITRGLDMGADDYITKPFHISVLESRIQAVLRRAAVSCMLVCGNIRMDKKRMQVWVGEESVPLTSLEYRLLQLLMENKGCILPRNRLLEKLWDVEGNFVNDNTLTVAMKRLREKLHHEPCITTVRGIGYRMEETE
ncbi:response regulator transcription factor [Lachnospiraceae bacterium 48-21]|nr:response regulator transcription factor [Dorea sp.]